MVGTRWESSSRPLFVRTVWKDGHHHVVLRNDDAAEAPTARSPRRNLSSGRSTKTTPPISAESGSNFKVPSAKLLLASLRSFAKDPKMKLRKKETMEFVKGAVTVDIIPSVSLRYSDLNKQVTFKNERRPTKSSSVDANRCCSDDDDYDSTIATPHPFSYDSYWTEPLGSNLSERVMIWLDLAVQSRKQFENLDMKKRVMTAKACPIVQRKRTAKNVGRSEVKKENNDRKESETSRIEDDRSEDDKRETREKENLIRISHVKRQLHIFLPDLPKKASDSGSFLSSKCSSFQGL